MKIKEVSKTLTYYVELDEDVDNPEFLWYRTDEQIDDLLDEIGSYFNLYDEVRDTVREALNRWGTPEPIALEDREPQQTDLDEEDCCWWRIYDTARKAREKLNETN